MSRIENALVGAGQAYNVTGAPLLNLEHAGQNGLATNLAAIANNTPYSQQQSIILLTRAPKAFEAHPDGQLLTAMLKTLIEKWPKQWEGFNLTLQTDPNETAQGWDRQQLRTPGAVYRQSLTLTCTGDELYNASVSSFWNYYARTFLGDPSTQAPNLAELNNVPDDWLMDRYTFDILAIEPDPTRKKAVKAVACAGLWPQELPEVNMRRNITDSQNGKEINIGFPCIYDDGYHVKKIAQQFLEQIGMYSVNPNYKPSFTTQIDADVAAAKTGLLDQSNEAKRTWKP